MKPGEDIGDIELPGVGEVILLDVNVGVVVRPDPSASSGIASEDLRSSGSVGWWSDKWGQWGLDEREELLENYESDDWTAARENFEHPVGQENDGVRIAEENTGQTVSGYSYFQLTVPWL